MFGGQVNPYDEIVTKATDENLASEDWDINLQICDKVNDEGTNGARNATAALVKRLAHRNPNVQLYSLELANTLAQNCGKPLHEELASRQWTGALGRLVNDRSTAKPVQRKALKYIKDWTQQFERTGDTNLGLMTELYDQLRAKHQFDESEPAPANEDDERRRREEEELARVLELSKQETKGGSRGAQPPTAGQASSAGASAYPAAPSYAQPPKSQPTAAYAQPVQSQPAAAAHNPYAAPAEEAPVDMNSATRVRALYSFTSSAVGELNFERGDVIRVLDRGFQEWWRGASNGRIGIFPVNYVEALPEPTPRELQEEAQEEARVFASLGLVEQLLHKLKGIDPARGDRIDDHPEIEQMYHASVSLQTQVNALIKKYSDQKAELEHMNQNFIRAMHQYQELRQPQPQPHQPQQQYFPPQQGYPAQQDFVQPYPAAQPAQPAQPTQPAPVGPHDYQTYAHDQSQPQQHYEQHQGQPQQHYEQHQAHQAHPGYPQAQPPAHDGMYYHGGASTSSLGRVPGAPGAPGPRQGSGSFSQQGPPPGVSPGIPDAHQDQAAWAAQAPGQYYGQQPNGPPPQGHPQQAYQPGYDVAAGMNRMSVQ